MQFTTGAVVIYRTTTDTFSQCEGKECAVLRVYPPDNNDGYHAGYRLKCADWEFFAYPSEVHPAATDWKAVAHQHARQRDEAITQRDSAQQLLEVAKAQVTDLAARMRDVEKQRNYWRDERDAFAGRCGEQNSEIERLQEQLEEAQAGLRALKETQRIHDAVRDLVRTENARRTFSNSRRSEFRPGAKPLPLISL